MRRFLPAVYLAVCVFSSALIATLAASKIPSQISAGSAASAQASISGSDPDFSIVLFPDTQYYNGSYNYLFQDQVNWVVANQAVLNIKMVIGLGDIVDGGGYPVDSTGKIEIGRAHV